MAKAKKTDANEPCTASAPPTQAMAAVGLSFVDVQDVGRHVVHLLQTQGETALRAVANLVKLVAAVTGRNFVQVFALINAETTDVQALIAAVRQEFGISD